MASVMGYKIVLLLFWLMSLSTAEVSLKGVWKENFGWEVTCTWQTWLNDTVQSVRMFRNGDQFFIFRPEIHGLHFNEVLRGQEFIMAIDCKMASPQGQRGSCVVKVELFQNAIEDSYKCEMSGEKPMFRLEEKDYTVFVPPSDAILKPVAKEGEEGRRDLNCTSSGLPAPKLVFSVDGQKIPEDFTHTNWNSTTKLWHSWASYNPQKNLVLVLCTPEAATKIGTVERGRSAEWVVTPNSSSCFDVTKIILLVSLTLTLLR